ncbi:leucine-rich repeat-containing protein 40 [Folsomia candida]|uniref:Leucine-rich repeat-containing protein 20 n=1 Tax=Folsomia candida TaxID=158441 RepID=A0A226DGZ8_FOLCA|nr:leucine-rich repeat-containing protein 40 [Folsomia candida]OXA43881.1 Leucine-rich repeat-containing protein 20 [Folsomia candida]
MASGVTRVIERCDNAVESEYLDLSECELMNMPDAVFHLMRNTVIRGCNLSHNVITKIPAKLPLKFSIITELNLSHNRLGKLPDELKELHSLEKLNISHNAFLSMPNAIYQLAQLKELNAEKNFIEDVDLNRLKGQQTLESVDLRENPLIRQIRSSLEGITSVRILVSPIVTEEWELIPGGEES